MNEGGEAGFCCQSLPQKRRGAGFAATPGHVRVRIISARPASKRERYANFIVPTLESPFEVWAVEYVGGQVRNRYIGLFQGERDFLVSVRVNLDGSVVWNVMQADDKQMNGRRVGTLIYDK